MSKGVRKLLEMGTAVVVMGACCAGLFALYKAFGISMSDNKTFGMIIAPALLVGAAAQHGTRRWLRERYAQEEILVKVKKQGRL